MQMISMKDKKTDLEFILFLLTTHYRLKGVTHEQFPATPLSSEMFNWRRRMFGNLQSCQMPAKHPYHGPQRLRADGDRSWVYSGLDQGTIIVLDTDNRLFD